MKKIILFLLLVFVLVSAAAAQEALPDLVVTEITAPVSVSTGETISIGWTVKNQGTGSFPEGTRWYEYVYLSADIILP